MVHKVLVTIARGITPLLLGLCSVAGRAWGQFSDRWDPNLTGRPYDEVKQSIFEQEHKLLKTLGHSSLLMETYAQSLGFHGDRDMDKTRDRNREGLLEDLYYLADVDFSGVPVDRPRLRLIFGNQWRQQYVKGNNDLLERLIPEGQLYMFFPDMLQFEDETYKLIYRHRATVNGTECFEFSVIPRPGAGGSRFSGSIWVETSSLAIVRVNGEVVSKQPWYKRPFSGRFFHFDSFRERDARGNWVPSVTYFDDRRTFLTDGDLRNDYRGYSLLWRRSVPGNVQSVSDSRLGGDAARVLEQLERDGVLAKVGPEEQNLNAIVLQIKEAASIRETIQCRILVTTPVEMFPVGSTIVVSRGLLNLVPNKSVLAVFLARSMAAIMQADPRPVLPHSMFEFAKTRDFPGLGITTTPTRDAAIEKQALLLLQGSGFESGIRETVEFLGGLQKGSKRFHNLLQPRFGLGIIPSGKGFAELTPAMLNLHALNDIRLKETFRVATDGTIRRVCSECRSDNGSW